MAHPLVPSEAYEGELLVQWLELNGYKFSHLAQNTFTRSYAIKAKLKRAGVRPGVPDYLIILKSRHLLFIELKKAKGGRTSREQEDWIGELNTLPGVTALVCHGHEAAQDAILRCDSKPE